MCPVCGISLLVCFADRFGMLRNRRHFWYQAIRWLAQCTAVLVYIECRLNIHSNRCRAYLAPLPKLKDTAPELYRATPRLSPWRGLPVGNNVRTIRPICSTLTGHVLCRDWIFWVYNRAHGYLSTWHCRARLLLNVVSNGPWVWNFAVCLYQILSWIYCSATVLKSILQPSSESLDVHFCDIRRTGEVPEWCIYRLQHWFSRESSVGNDSFVFWTLVWLRCLKRQLLFSPPLSDIILALKLKLQSVKLFYFWSSFEIQEV